MGNACSSGAVNAPKRGEPRDIEQPSGVEFWWYHPRKRGKKPLPPIKGTCLHCGAGFEVSRRGNRGKKFCNERCAATYNMALQLAGARKKHQVIEPCLRCHDAMFMKSEQSAGMAGEKRRFILKRRRKNGWDWKKVVSMASRAHHKAQGRLVGHAERATREQDRAWSQEWRGVVDCHYAKWGYAYVRAGINRRAIWKKRYKHDAAFTAKRALRNQVARIKRITTYSKRSNELLGCTYEEARKWIESKFQRGMSWANVGEWEIDHVIPISAFDLTDEQQVRCVNHFTNLQPLWAADNRRKRDKIERPHQLALL
jgi:hypothetical protein